MPAAAATTEPRGCHRHRHRHQYHRRPYLTLAAAFLAWKALLLAIAAGACLVAPTYDTSSALLLSSSPASSGCQNSRDELEPSPGFVRALVTRLISWDAVYFVANAQRGGYLFEQEWAFGLGMPRAMGAVVRALQALGVVQTPQTHTQELYAAALAGIAIAHASHFLSVLVLYRLGLRVWRDARWALASALLHVLSPAGVFLSAPYQEGPYSLLSFGGFLLLAESSVVVVAAVDAGEGGGGGGGGGEGAAGGKPGGWTVPTTTTTTTTPPTATRTTARRHALTLAAGAAFGLATLFRSNGLLNGLPFAAEFVWALHDLVETDRPPREDAVRLLVVGASGLFVAAGFAVPQVWAYRLYCGSGAKGTGTGLPRPWCGDLIPSIYSYVQERYWNVGFLRYWTPSNAALFLLAAPMLFVLGKSGKDVFFEALSFPERDRARRQSLLQTSRSPRANSNTDNNTIDIGTTPAPERQNGNESGDNELVDSYRLGLTVASLAAAQAVLALLALTSYHVQIITRLASGYPAWTWWAAACLRRPRTRDVGAGVVAFAVIYACVQAALFASFLPPA